MKSKERQAKSFGVRLRALAAEGGNLIRSGFGLTARERDGALLLLALFVLGLVVRVLRG
jgi:hypothetical protein